MKNLIKTGLIALSFVGVFSFASINKVEAQGMSIQDFVKLLIALDVIPAEKANAARAAVGLAAVEATPVQTTGSDSSASPVNEPVVQPVVSMENITLTFGNQTKTTRVENGVEITKISIPVSISGGTWVKGSIRMQNGMSSNNSDFTPKSFSSMSPIVFEFTDSDKNEYIGTWTGNYTITGRANKTYSGSINLSVQ